MRSGRIAARMTGILLLFVCAVLAAQAPPARQPAPPTEMQKALEEFKTQTRDARAALRQPPKAGVPAAPAGAPWHGRIFENLRNDFLDAVPHQITQRGGTKSLLRRNQFGFNVAGPLVIPRLYQGSRRTYVSFSYEGVRERVARSYLQTLPTMPERTGDFSAVVDQAGELLPIYDPASTRPNPGFNPAQPVTKDNLEYLRTPFPGNKIDAVRLEPVALKALDYYPSPNASAGPFARNNYFLTTPETNNADGVIVKVDHNLRARHRISVSLNSTERIQGRRGPAADRGQSRRPGSRIQQPGRGPSNTSSPSRRRRSSLPASGRRSRSPRLVSGASPTMRAELGFAAPARRPFRPSPSLPTSGWAAPTRGPGAPGPTTTGTTASRTRPATTRWASPSATAVIRSVAFSRPIRPGVFALRWLDEPAGHRRHGPWFREFPSGFGRICGQELRGFPLLLSPVLHPPLGARAISSGKKSDPEPVPRSQSGQPAGGEVRPAVDGGSERHQPRQWASWSYAHRRPQWRWAGLPASIREGGAKCEPGLEPLQRLKDRAPRRFLAALRCPGDLRVAVGHAGFQRHPRLPLLERATRAGRAARRRPPASNTRVARLSARGGQRYQRRSHLPRPPPAGLPIGLALGRSASSLSPSS